MSKYLRVLLVCWLLAAQVAPVAADLHRYVNLATGNNAFDGTTADRAWKNISRANSQLETANTANGDIYLHIAAGDYANAGDAMPNPPGAPLNGKRYHIIGADLGNAGNTRLPGGSIRPRYTSLKGFEFAGNVSFDSTARYDTLRFCSVKGSLTVNGADYNYIGSNVFDTNGGYVSICSQNSPGVAGANYQCRGNVIESNTFLGLSGDAGSASFQTGTSGVAPSQPATYSVVDTFNFERNRVFINSVPGGEYSRWHYMTRNARFKYNYWDITNNGTPGWAMRFRDSSFAITMSNDTIITRGPSRNRIDFATSGITGGSWVPVPVTLTADSLFFYSNNSSPFFFQDQMKGVTIRNSVFVGASPAEIYRSDGPNTIRGCTFAVNTVQGPYDMHGIFMSSDLNADWTDTLFFDHNILYSMNWTPAPDPAGWAPGSKRAGIWLHGENTFTGVNPHFKSNHNLYFYRGATSTAASALGDRSIAYRSGAGMEVFAPGDSTSTRPSHWENTFKNDSASVYGSPRFADSTFSTSFNPRILEDSYARGRGLGGIDIGARAFQSAAGRIWVSPSLLTKHDVAMERPDTLAIDVHNFGTGTLAVTAISLTGSIQLGAVTPATLSIPAGESRYCYFILQPSASFYQATGVITLTSDDPNRPSIQVPIEVGAAISVATDEPQDSAP